MCDTWFKDFTDDAACETGLCLPPPSPRKHHHNYSHIHVPHLSNQIFGCVHSALALYMNYKPAYTYFISCIYLHERVFGS